MADESLTFDRSYQDCAANLQTPELAGVVAAFVSNLDRVAYLYTLPVELINVGLITAKLMLGMSKGSFAEPIQVRSGEGGRNRNPAELLQEMERWMRNQITNPETIAKNQEAAQEYLQFWTGSDTRFATGT